jgi:predicted dehydrogenase
MSNVDPTWYFMPKGGGPLYDRVVYEAHTLTGILGPAKRVTALSGICVPEREFRGKKIQVQVDDNTLMLLDFGDSFYAFVHGAVGGGVPTWIFGTDGVIRYEKGGPTLNGEPIDFPGKSDGARRLPHVNEMHQGVPSAHIFEDIMQLVDWIRDDKPTIVTAEHARHVIDIFESAYRSARTGETQELTTSFTPAD